MKSFARFGVVRSLALLAAMVALLLLLPASAAFADTIIDHFDATQTVEQTGVGSTFSDKADASILGGHRNLTVAITEGTGKITSDANVTVASQFAHSQPASTFGTSTLIYDGDANQALNATGLGGVSLTSGGADAIVMVVRSDDWYVRFTVTVYTDATHCSERQLTLNGGVSAAYVPKALVFRHSEFTTACDNAANMGNVGAIQIYVDGSRNPQSDSLDVVFGLLESSSLDFGDLPDTYVTNFNQTPSSSGPGHIKNDLYMGSAWDAETGDSVASADALHDDITRSPDDEDGVLRANGPWTVGATGGAVDVTVSGNGCLGGWFDFNKDGNFGDPNTLDEDTNELILNRVSVTAGTTRHTFNVPSGFTTGWYAARFRLFPRDPNGTCTQTAKSWLATVDGGEVEDYRWYFGTLAVTLGAFTAEPQAGGVLVAWETVSETDNAGFNLYRADAADGAQTQLNKTLIAALAPGSTDGQSYTWQDLDAQPGQTYYYWLEDVDLDGTRTLHGPVSVTLSQDENKPAGPTAVRLQGLTALPISAALPWAGAALLALGGGALLLRRRR